MENLNIKYDDSIIKLLTYAKNDGGIIDFFYKYSEDFSEVGLEVYCKNNDYWRIQSNLIYECFGKKSGSNLK